MVSDLILLITDMGNDIAKVKYSFPSALPAHLSAELELTEFLFPADGFCLNEEYLVSAKAISDIISRQRKMYLLSERSRSRLELLNKVYNALCFEKVRLYKLKIIRLKKCDLMLSASKRIADLIRSSTFEELTSEDFHVMKRYLMAFIPDTSELMDYPGFYMEKIRPVFDLLNILIEIAPAENEKKYISNIYRLFYGGSKNF